MHRTFCLALAALAAGIASAHEPAHRSHSTAPAEETAFGRQADPKRATRTIDVDMSDRMRFSPAELTVRQGETVRFRVKNSGKVMHEMVLGRGEDLRQHAELMRSYPHMEHQDAWMVHVPPGRTGVLAWQFTRAGEFQYGCLVPGHFEAGMVGRIRVLAE